MSGPRHARILRYIQTFATPVPGGCWEWALARTVEGYGILRITPADPLNPFHEIRAARWALSLLYDRPLTRVEVALHSCGNPACVHPHPEHLFLGDAARRPLPAPPP